jgi:hypothetical protein
VLRGRPIASQAFGQVAHLDRRDAQSTQFEDGGQQAADDAQGGVACAQTVGGERVVVASVFFAVSAEATAGGVVADDHVGDGGEGTGNEQDGHDAADDFQYALDLLSTGNRRGADEIDNPPPMHGNVDPQQDDRCFGRQSM